ncbi:hypothetical protein DUE52_21310 [Larkinella punicea]|uniref:Uncharacterized protein n=2 Tax=Larkinella punicea TaxID=2315727 RepID=A0A368JM64_9BACT|nr:hypothetical protein DUE52_21310 [Larkinella punicea]
MNSMKNILVGILIGGWMSGTTGWAAPVKPAGFNLVNPAVANWLAKWENRVNRLSSRVDSAETDTRKLASLQDFFVADTVKIPDLRQPAVIYQHVSPQTSARNWVNGFAQLFWEDVFHFQLEPTRMRQMAKKKNRTRLEVTASVALTGILSEGRQPLRQRDEWVLELDATERKGTYQDLVIHSIRRKADSVELPGLTIAKVAGYHEQMQHWFVRFLADSTRQTQALGKLKQLMRSDTVVVMTGEKADTLTLAQLLALRLRPEAIARFQIQSFDLEYCDDFIENPDKVVVGQLIVLEGVTVSVESPQIYRRKRTDAVPFPAGRREPWVQAFNLIVHWNQPDQLR